MRIRSRSLYNLQCGFSKSNLFGNKMCDVFNILQKWKSISLKIRSRRAVTRPSRVSPSSRCPSGWRFAAVARYQASCSRAASALRASWDLVPSECREVPVYCFPDWHLLPYFVDALGICVFFSGSCLLCWCGLDALDRGMVYLSLEEGRGGWAGLLMPS